MSGTGYREAVFDVTSAVVANLSHVNIQMAHIKAFGIRASSSDNAFTMGVRRVLISSTESEVTFWTSGYCKLFYA